MSSKTANAAGAAIIVWVLVLILGIIGWVINIVTLIGSYQAMGETEFWLRLVGVPVPILGMIMGWC